MAQHHSLQMRINDGGTHLYNPQRDVAHNLQFVMMEVARRLEHGRWPELAEYLKAQGVTDERVGEACAAFCDFVGGGVGEKPQETMEECLRRCGWFDAPDPARLAVMATLGTVMAGLYWTGAREATMEGHGPALGSAELRKRGALCSRLMTMPRRLRGLYYQGLRLRDAWALLRRQ